MKTVKEQDIQKGILQYLRLKGVKCWKARSVGIHKADGGYIPLPALERGVADIIGCLKGGRLLAIEVKRKGNKPTPDQQQFIDDINHLGGLGLIAYSLGDIIDKV